LPAQLQGSRFETLRVAIPQRALEEYIQVSRRGKTDTQATLDYIQSSSGVPLDRELELDKEKELEKEKGGPNGAGPVLLPPGLRSSEPTQEQQPQEEVPAVPALPDWIPLRAWFAYVEM
jgi:hypothetical protein